MIFRNCIQMKLFRLTCYSVQKYRFVTQLNQQITTSDLCTSLGIDKTKAEYFCRKYPSASKINRSELENMIKTMKELRFNKRVLLENPVLFSLHPITLRCRYQVLEECGFYDITPEILLQYLNIVKQQPVWLLKEKNLIPTHITVENRLAGYMTQWPTSLTTLIHGDTNNKTLLELRLKIIQQYLTLMIKLTEVEFKRGLKSYPNIKHRPLTMINETLTLLQSVVLMPNSKIKSNLFLIHCDPENIKNIIFKLRNIAGIDIKEIVKRHPKILMMKYETLVETRDILQQYRISHEAQMKCFELYTLGSDTIRERLQRATQIPEIQTFYNHPRFLKIIFHNKEAMQRLQKLYSCNKKCLTLHVLSGSSDKYKLFEKAPGDRCGKGKDLVFCLSEYFGDEYKSNEIRSKLRKHPFWIYVPIVQVKFVFEKLSRDFSKADIYDNCPLLLYPWNKIRDTIQMIKTNNLSLDQVNIAAIDKAQTLSLVLYLLEKNHYFTGNGVWTEEQIKNVVDLSISQECVQNSAIIK